VIKAPRKSRDRNECIEAIRLRSASGLPLNILAVCRECGWLASAAQDLFGSWDNALRAAGLDPGKIRKRTGTRTWAAKKVIDALKKRHDDGLALNSLSVEMDDVGLVSAARRYFGSYPEALRVAGFDVSTTVLRESALMTEEEIILALKERREKGLPINQEALAVEKNHRLLNSAQRRFTTYQKAVEAAGIDYATVRLVREWSADIVQNEMRAILKRGEPLSAGYISSKYKSLHHAGSKRFGSWRGAVTALGLDYDAILREARRKGCEKGRVTKLNRKA